MRGAWLDDDRAVHGLGEALLPLRDEGAVYTLVAIGLLAFGAFSLITAFYRIIADFESRQWKPKRAG